MQPAKFLDRVLGIWSSHPTWLKTRMRTILGVLLVLFASVTGVLGWIVTDASGRSLLFRNSGLMLRGVVLIIAFLAGFLATVGLLARVATVQVLSRCRGREFEGRPDFWVLAVIVVVGVVLPVAFGRDPELSPLVQRLIQMLAFVPVVALLWLIRWQESTTGSATVPPPGGREILTGSMALATSAAFLLPHPASRKASV